MPSQQTDSDVIQEDMQNILTHFELLYPEPDCVPLMKSAKRVAVFLASLQRERDEAQEEAKRWRRILSKVWNIDMEDTGLDLCD